MTFDAVLHKELLWDFSFSVLGHGIITKKLRTSASRPYFAVVPSQKSSEKRKTLLVSTSSIYFVSNATALFAQSKNFQESL